MFVSGPHIASAPSKKSIATYVYVYSLEATYGIKLTLTF